MFCKDNMSEYTSLNEHQYPDCSKSADMSPRPGIPSTTPCEGARKTSQRKDTKDSGYGGCSSECEEEQQLLPDWCYQCLQRGEANQDGACKEVDDKRNCESDNEHKKKDASEEGKQNLSNVQTAWMTRFEDLERLDIQSEKCQSFKSRKPTNDDQALNQKMATNETGELKPNKRHRRMTPIPLSNPVKISLASRPDCLFVEEEDMEDLTNFDTDNDFVYQGLFQLSTSPRSSPKQLKKSIKSKAVFHKMDGKEDTEVSKTASQTSFDEVPNSEQFAFVSERQEVTVVEKNSDLSSGASPERNSPTTTPELPRLYMRSRSENDACLLSNRTSRRSQLSRIESEGEEYFREHIDRELFGMSESDFKSKGRMSTNEIPHIELEPAASLPDWMKEAKAEDISIELSTEESTKNDSKGSCDTEKQPEPSVRMRNKDMRSSWKSTKQSGNIDEDVIKIYTPQKHYEGQKPKRSRKLTPARATSPSLEKLADLQSQVFAFTLAENDSD
ncbi:uncharacterized protein LOC135681351 isoform X1 [Rhopilema esculentum]|uniref:uncharacterized protein LOC135681351 isoform X1 n=2 Tax=Rhopilema esculentum TaxID=499914 RepID=UPI0031D89125